MLGYTLLLTISLAQYGVTDISFKLIYTEKDMSKFLYSLSTGRYQDAKKQDPQVLL